MKDVAGALSPYFLQVVPDHTELRIVLGANGVQTVWPSTATDRPTRLSRPVRVTVSAEVVQAVLAAAPAQFDLIALKVAGRLEGGMPAATQAYPPDSEPFDIHIDAVGIVD